MDEDTIDKLVWDVRMGVDKGLGGDTVEDVVDEQAQDAGIGVGDIVGDIINR